MRLGYCELTAQHKTPRLAWASPEPLALNVPTLQAADMPLPHGQNNMFNILCALGQAAAGRGWQWVHSSCLLPLYVPSPC